MKQKPFTKAQRTKLIKNSNAPGDHAPVVKFFCPWGAATWLITELDEETGIMFGLCDLGHGSPELGYVSLAELSAIRGPFGLTIERDIYFKGDQPVSKYADQAREAGRIYA